MKKSVIILTLLITLLLCSCGTEQNEQQGADKAETAEISEETDEYTIEKISYCETVFEDQKDSTFLDNGDVRYFIENTVVSKEEFDVYSAEQAQKQSADWIDFELKGESARNTEKIHERTAV